MQRTHRTEAIVLKKHKYGEADNVLSLLAPAGGRVGAIAKGVRKTTSRFGGRLEPFSHVDLMLHRGRGSLQTITQVETIDSFEAIRADYDKLGQGATILDLLDRVAVEDHGDERLFGLAVASLAALAGAGCCYDRIVAASELKMMAVIGYRPHLDCCVICGEAGPAIHFSRRAGGIMCAGCALTDTGCEPIASSTIPHLQALLGAQMGEVEGLEVAAGEDEATARLLRGFVAYHVQSRLKSREFLERDERTPA